jgi:hypothetical protein
LYGYQTKELTKGALVRVSGKELREQDFRRGDETERVAGDGAW